MLRNIVINLLISIAFLPLIKAQQYTCTQSRYSETSELYSKALELVADSNENKAIPILKRITAKDTAFADAWYLLGKIYHFKAIVSQYDMMLSANTAYYFNKAEKCFLNSVVLCNRIDSYNAYFYLGENMFINRQYDLAGLYLKQYKQLNTDNEIALNKANEYLYNCIQWEEWKDSANIADYEELKGVNTVNDETDAAVSKDAVFVIYRNKLKRNPSMSIYNTPAEKWVYSYLEGVDSINKPVYSSKYSIINIPDDSECHALLPFNNSTKVFLTTEPKQSTGKKDPNSVDIFQANFENKKLSEYSKPKNINTPTSFEGYPTLTANEQTMYFVSNRNAGVGGMDIYETKMSNDGNWMKPVNLGNVINTVNDEINPTITADGKHLFFASNGHFGLGGFDIFVSHKTDTGWSKPQNLGKPVNSYDDDKDFTFSSAENYAIFVRKYLSPIGGCEIYRTKLSNFIECNQNSIVSGIILDHNNKVLSDIELNIISMLTNERIPVVFDKYTGRFSAVIPNIEHRYLFSISKEGYSFTDKILNTVKGAEFYYKSVNMFPIRVGEKFELTGLDFPKNSFVFEASANILLADFVEFMQENIAVKIRINGRMATVDDLKTRLSEKRAKSVYDYLIEKGVEQERLQYEGFSSSTGKNSSFIEFEIIDVD